MSRHEQANRLRPMGCCRQQGQALPCGETGAPESFLRRSGCGLTGLPLLLQEGRAAGWQEEHTTEEALAGIQASGER